MDTVGVDGEKARAEEGRIEGRHGGDYAPGRMGEIKKQRVGRYTRTGAAAGSRGVATAGTLKRRGGAETMRLCQNTHKACIGNTHELEYRTKGEEGERGGSQSEKETVA